MKNSIGWDVADALELSSPIGIHFEHTLFNQWKNPENTHLNRTIIVENKSIIIYYLVSLRILYTVVDQGRLTKNGDSRLKVTEVYCSGWKCQKGFEMVSRVAIDLCFKSRESIDLYTFLNGLMVWHIWTVYQFWVPMV